MALITLPTGFVFTDIEWALDVPAQVNRSGFTSRRKVIGLPGAERWTAKLVVEPITTEIDERAWRAFMLKMRGVENEATIRPLEFQVPAGSAPFIRTGSGSGYDALLGGMTAGATFLRAGEFLTIPLSNGDFRMVCLTADIVANGAGNATATFEPALGVLPDVGAYTSGANPFCRMNFVDRKQGWRTVDGISQFVLDMEEAL